MGFSCLAGVGAACGGTKSPTQHSGDSHNNLTIVRNLKQSWLTTIHQNARRDHRVFPSPPRRTLIARLNAASRSHTLFQIDHITLTRPRQYAPLVVLHTRDKDALAKAWPEMIRVIDPKRPTGDDRTGWSYEGIFVEATEPSGAPFLVTFNHWRGPHPGGGQWAATNELLPYATSGQAGRH